MLFRSDSNFMGTGKRVALELNTGKYAKVLSFSHSNEYWGVDNISRTISLRYSARNAILPIVVVLGLQLGRLLSGQVIIEELFAWPGVGRLMVEGVQERDYFMVQAVVLIMAALLAFLNLAAELIHAWLDPRIRL